MRAGERAHARYICHGGWGLAGREGGLEDKVWGGG